jgi:hypothetical protein
LQNVCPELIKFVPEINQPRHTTPMSGCVLS